MPVHLPPFVWGGPHGSGQVVVPMKSSNTITSMSQTDTSPETLSLEPRAMTLIRVEVPFIAHESSLKGILHGYFGPSGLIVQVCES